MQKNMLDEELEGKVRELDARAKKRNASMIKALSLEH